MFLHEAYDSRLHLHVNNLLYHYIQKGMVAFKAYHFDSATFWVILPSSWILKNGVQIWIIFCKCWLVHYVCSVHYTLMCKTVHTLCHILKVPVFKSVSSKNEIDIYFICIFVFKYMYAHTGKIVTMTSTPKCNRRGVSQIL